MVVLEAGYAMRLEYLKQFFEDGTDDGYNLANLSADMTCWWRDLPKETRVQTPYPKWMRYFLETGDDVEQAQRTETYNDAKKKSMFAHTFQQFQAGENKNFDEKEMGFRVREVPKPYQTRE